MTSVTDASSEIKRAATGPGPEKRGLAWILRRAMLGVTIMLAVTGVAALIAHASIDAPEAVEEILIGAHAQQLLVLSIRAEE